MDTSDIAHCLMTFVRRSASMVLALWALPGVGCGPQAAAVPTAPTSSQPMVTLTGTVTDFAGAPVSGARICAFPLTGYTDAWSASCVDDHLATDASGRYRVQVPMHQDRAYVTVQKEGFLQPCAAQVTLESNVSVDISITREPVINDLPVLPDRRQVGGAAYVVTTTGRRPRPGVAVGVETQWSGSVIAHTRTDEDGRYRLCGLPTDTTLTLFAFEDPQYLHQYPPPGGDAVVDFELRP